MNTLPRIGISLDWEAGGDDKWSKRDFYALRQNYCTSVSRHGALALPLPHVPEQAEAYLDMMHGLLVTGGNFDVDPKYYGATDTHDTVMTKDARTEFEFATIQGALVRKMPILGICGGEQIMAVALNGSLIQHIPDSIADCLEHEQEFPQKEPGHSVTVERDSLLYRIANTTELQVNTAHHQSVDDPGDMRVTATAPDGVIEAVEYDDHPFCLGVQWHPEYDISSADTAIFKAFIDAAIAYRDR